MDKTQLNDLDLFSILSDLHEGIIISDTQGKIIFYNQTQGQIDDLEPSYAIGKEIKDLYEVSEKTSPTMRCLLSGKAIKNETMVYRTRLGKVANIISNVFPLYNGNKLAGAINFSKDYQQLEQMTSAAGILSGKRKGNGARFKFKDIIGSDPEMLNALHIAQVSASSPSPIMISGETGTGKELFAQSIHNHSGRKHNLFIPVNCAAIPENLLEGILFGTSKGSFTGAIDKSGLFEQANGGTIFLDELDSMPLSLQAKILRVVQEKKVRKLGSLRETDLDLKIISSVSEPPHTITEKKSLRKDLFYRMGVVSVILPPLRKRKKDIRQLVRYFIAKCNQSLKKEVKNVSQRVEKLFYGYHWPGNVRELEHIVEASMNMVNNDATIRLPHLPLHVFNFVKKDREKILQSRVKNPMISGEVGFSKDLPESQAINEKQMILNALETFRGNAAKAARALSVSPQSLHYKIKKYNISPKEFKQSGVIKQV